MERRGQAQRRNARQAYNQQQRNPSGSGQSQRSRGNDEQFPPYIQQSPRASESVGRLGSDSRPTHDLTSTVPYAASVSMQQSPMLYGQGIPVTEATQQQSQNYVPYGSTLMYGMGQPQGTQPGQQSYEQIQPYSQRPGCGSETLAAPFGMPQYYLAGQVIPTSGTVPDLPNQSISSSRYHPSDTYHNTGSPAMHPYATNVIPSSQATPYDPYAQQARYTQQLQAPSDEQAFETYHAQIRNIFTLAHEGALCDIGPQLVQVSQYLLGNIEGLGLTRDDETLHDGRIRLWDEFNRAWLVSLQRQLDLTQQAVRSQQPLEGNLSIMDAQTLERLSSELVRLCDNIEKHGLVDYQMGVAEEEIMELLLRCLSLLNPTSGRTSEGASRTGAPAAGSARKK